MDTPWLGQLYHLDLLLLEWVSAATRERLRTASFDELMTEGEEIATLFESLAAESSDPPIVSRVAAWNAIWMRSAHKIITLTATGKAVDEGTIAELVEAATNSATFGSANRSGVMHAASANVLAATGYMDASAQIVIDLVNHCGELHDGRGLIRIAQLRSLLMNDQIARRLPRATIRQALAAAQRLKHAMLRQEISRFLKKYDSGGPERPHLPI